MQIVISVVFLFCSLLAFAFAFGTFSARSGLSATTSDVTDDAEGDARPSQKFPGEDPARGNR